MRRLIFALVYMIYSGVRTQHVDNAAHIGGLVCGIFIMALINLIETHKNNYTDYNI
jgi:rhomboid protease GluP